MHALDLPLARCLVEAVDHLVEMRRQHPAQDGRPVLSNCHWILSDQGQLLGQIDGDQLTLHQYVRLAKERSKGHFTMRVYPCLWTAREFFDEFIQPLFLVADQGILAGQVVGPIAGTNGLLELNDWLRDTKLVGTADWYEPLSGDDFRVLEAVEPWQLISTLMDAS